ncbi:uncharacterized protein LOC132750390 [Ruditapes philippinarum]|uniref:uncharacterized protein LOC132750390 n=1 Tax=Ruditapes philippinarum TaxID=129788 RepID=UPI00295AF9C4|nr:uncharacterized protein LOC132750390 [Ruditapes philippinarum]
MEFRLQVIILSFTLVVSLVLGYPGNSKSQDEDERKGFQRRMIQEQRRFLNGKFAEVLDTIDSTLGSKLEHITDVVESIERRQKLKEFCTDGICGDNGTCSLSEDEETYECHCDDTHAGEHCEITGICNVDLFHAQQEPLMLGREFPRCDEDGSFAGMQYQGSMAYCVTSDRIELNYSVQRWETGDNMNCQCARDEHANTEEGKVFKCQPNGNYPAVACGDEKCWCQDSMGQKYGDAIDLGDLDSPLECS